MHFLALVLTENKDAIELFERLAPSGSEHRRSASGHLELVIDLPGPGVSTAESRLGRALRADVRGLDNRPLR